MIYLNSEFRNEARVHLKAKICSGIEFLKHNNTLLPNKFFYVVPMGLIAPNEVPDYAGLIYVDEFGTCTKIKDGKFLHKDKLDVKKIFTKTYYAYERELIQKLKACEHKNINRKDGLDECLDCGVRNY